MCNANQIECQGVKRPLRFYGYVQVMPCWARFITEARRFANWFVLKVTLVLLHCEHSRVNASVYILC